MIKQIFLLLIEFRIFDKQSGKKYAINFLITFSNSIFLFIHTVLNIYVTFD